MTTVALIHGAVDVGWYWHVVDADRGERGHDVVAPDLPRDDDSAELSEYADTVIQALGERPNLVLVAQSLGSSMTTRSPFSIRTFPRSWCSRP
jgi:pimeloyl-ACP methyl ester carboxylesterase